MQSNQLATGVGAISQESDAASTSMQQAPITPITPTQQTQQTPTDDFPYKRLNMTRDQLVQRFNNLKNYKPEIVEKSYYIKNVAKHLLRYSGKQLVINSPDNYYDVYDNISDYFIEHVRVDCIRSDQTQSVRQYWNSCRDEIVAYCMKKYGIVNTHNLRESLYDLISECNTFKPSLAVCFIKMFNATTILDISAGWGDRLIGALACNVNYVGVDPADLHKEYANIIDYFRPLIAPPTTTTSATSTNTNTHTPTTPTYTMIKSKFEEAVIPNLPYDMIFSSPPFFDLEKYVGEDQSYMFRTIDQWFEDFLMVSLNKAWNALIPNGHMVLYIADAYNRKPYVQRTIDRVNEFTGSRYIGCLPQMDVVRRKPPRPFYIWKKI